MLKTKKKVLRILKSNTYTNRSGNMNSISLICTFSNQKLKNSWLGISFYYKSFLNYLLNYFLLDSNFHLK